MWRFSWCLQSPEYVCSGFCQQLLLAVQIGSQNGPAGGGRQELLGGEHGLLLLVLSLLSEVQTVLAGGAAKLPLEPLVEVFYVREAAGYICLSAADNLLLRFKTAAACSRKEHTADREQEQVNQRAEALLNAYGNSILRLAYSYLHNMEDAEEILQDTLIQYLKAAPVLENEAHEKAWLLRVAGNLSKNRIAYNRLRSTDELQESLAAEQREDLSFVWEAVKDLPVKYREVIHLFYYEGLSTGEIASILKEKESTVRSRLMRGRERLRSILKEEYDFEGSI